MGCLLGNHHQHDPDADQADDWAAFYQSPDPAERAADYRENVWGYPGDCRKYGDKQQQVAHAISPNLLNNPDGM